MKPTIAINRTKPDVVIDVQAASDYQRYHISYTVLISVEDHYNSIYLGYNETHHHAFGQIYIQNVQPFRKHHVQIVKNSHYGISRVSDTIQFFSEGSGRFVFDKKWSEKV